MDEKYQKVIDYVTGAGKRLKNQIGQIVDIGVDKRYLTIVDVDKRYLTEEDLRIERDLKKIIEDFGSEHQVFAEEENDSWPIVKNVWAIDPISGTSTFLAGLPHYAIVVSHLINNKVNFAVVFDPAMDELYTAELGKGSFKNGKKIMVSEKSGDPPRIMLNLFSTDNNLKKEIFFAMIKSNNNIYKNRNSYGLNYCHVATGQYDGIVILTKDIFPELAGSLIIREAGGVFKNIAGEDVFSSDDKLFIAGNPAEYERLKIIMDDVLLSS
ncbi:MAG: inositol monophosphatase [Patescibacteria group bacterium]